jgi:hypothetical protein
MTFLGTATSQLRSPFALSFQSIRARYKGHSGAASRFLSSLREAKDRAKSWIDDAESKILKGLGEARPYHLEALVILGFNSRCNHESGKSFFFILLAARMVCHPPQATERN